MIRKILSLVLSCLFLLSCVACGASEPVAETDSDGSDGLFSEIESEDLTGSVEDSASQTPSDIPSDSASDTDSPISFTSDKQEETVEKVTVDDIFAASDHYVGLTDQLNGRIIICDLEVEDWSDDQAVVWEYQNTSFKNIAGIKFRDSEYYGEKVVLFCYPGGGVVLSYETKEILFSTEDIGWNPHSVELLPNGVFIVASSTDNRVDVFAPGNEIASQTLEFPNAHGVLWDPEYEAVWFVGTDLLAAYTLKGTTEQPSLVPIGGMEYRTPKSGMHDLAPVYGDPHALFVTCGSGIMKFDKKEEKFNYAYRGSKLGKNATYAPGVGNFADGVFVYTSIEKGKTVYQDWNTNEVHVYVSLSDIRGKNLLRRAPNDAYYKIRVLNFDYQ